MSKFLERGADDATINLDLIIDYRYGDSKNITIVDVFACFTMKTKLSTF